MRHARLSSDPHFTEGQLVNVRAEGAGSVIGRRVWYRLRCVAIFDGGHKFYLSLPYNFADHNYTFVRRVFDAFGLEFNPDQRRDSIGGLTNIYDQLIGRWATLAVEIRLNPDDPNIVYYNLKIPK